MKFNTFFQMSIKRTRSYISPSNGLVASDNGGHSCLSLVQLLKYSGDAKDFTNYSSACKHNQCWCCLLLFVPNLSIVCIIHMRIAMHYRKIHLGVNT